MIQRHIFAIGDNGFRTDSKSFELYHHILSHTRTPPAGKKKKLLLIPTASGDQESYIQIFQNFFEKLDLEINVLSLFRGTTPAHEALILEQDILYITGGNTRNLLTLWKDWKLDQFIRKAYENGTVLAGGSAGSLCWFKEGVTDSIPGTLSPLSCLGWLKGSNCPHYDDPDRRPSYLKFVNSGQLSSGYAAENGVALHFMNETFHEAISHYPNRRAFFVSREEEKEIQVRNLQK